MENLVLWYTQQLHTTNAFEQKPVHTEIPTESCRVVQDNGNDCMEFLLRAVHRNEDRLWVKDEIWQNPKKRLRTVQFLPWRIRGSCFCSKQKYWMRGKSGVIMHLTTLYEKCIWAETSTYGNTNRELSGGARQQGKLYRIPSASSAPKREKSSSRLQRVFPL